MLRPLDIYKSQGSLRFQLKEGYIDRSGGKVSYNEPTILLSFCKSSGDKVYDTKNSIKFAMSYFDYCRLLRAIGKDGIREEKTMIHKYGSRTTVFKVGPGQKDNTYMFAINQKEGNNENKLAIYADADELFGIKLFLEKAADVMLSEIRDQKGQGVAGGYQAKGSVSQSKNDSDDNVYTIGQASSYDEEDDDDE
jgi:hypothetical protein